MNTAVAMPPNFGDKICLEPLCIRSLRALILENAKHQNSVSSKIREIINIAGAMPRISGTFASARQLGFLAVYALVRRRMDFHMATLVYLPLSGMAPAYLAADCQLVSGGGRRQLRSAASRTCVVRRSYSNYGDRCFSAAGPKLWNSLPAELRQADIRFQQFKQ